MLQFDLIPNPHIEPFIRSQKHTAESFESHSYNANSAKNSRIKSFKKFEFYSTMSIMRMAKPFRSICPENMKRGQPASAVCKSATTANSLRYAR